MTEANTTNPITDSETVAQVQSDLRKLGYVNTGPVDGDMTPKGKTEAAILDVRNNLGLPLKPTIDAALLEAIKTAPPKEIPVEQAMATAPEIAPKVEAVRQTRWTRFWAKLTAWNTAAVIAVVKIVDQFDTAVEKLSPVKNFVGDIPWWGWFGSVGIVATLLAIYLGKTESSLVDAYQKGTVGDDNKEAAQ